MNIMKMKKYTKIKSWGNSLGIMLGKKELNENNINEGDLVKVLIKKMK